jgi:hypothetical protein
MPHVSPPSYPTLRSCCSFGRRGSGAAAAAAAAAGPVNRWGDAINELGKMPGPRMLPLLKLAMLENLELSQAAGSAATAPPPAEPTPPTSAAASEHVSAAPPPVGPSPAASEGAGSTQSGGGPVAARVAPAAPSTPAQHPGPSRVVQGGQAEGKPPVSGVDDLLGLFDEPAPQRLQARTLHRYTLLHTAHHPCLRCACCCHLAGLIAAAVAEVWPVALAVACYECRGLAHSPPPPLPPQALACLLSRCLG